MKCQIRKCDNEAEIDKRGEDSAGAQYHIRLCSLCYLKVLSMTMQDPEALKAIREANRDKPEAVRDAIEVVAGMSR